MYGDATVSQLMSYSRYRILSITVYYRYTRQQAEPPAWLTDRRLNTLLILHATDQDVMLSTQITCRTDALLNSKRPPSLMIIDYSSSSSSSTTVAACLKDGPLTVCRGRGPPNVGGADSVRLTPAYLPSPSIGTFGVPTNSSFE